MASQDHRHNVLSETTRVSYRQLPNSRLPTTEKFQLEKSNSNFCQIWESNPGPHAQQSRLRPRGQRGSNGSRYRAHMWCSYWSWRVAPTPNTMGWGQEDDDMVEVLNRMQGIHVNLMRSSEFRNPVLFLMNEIQIRKKLHYCIYKARWHDQGHLMDRAIIFPSQQG